MQDGDFEGFLLDTEGGDRKFFSRKKEVAELAERAWHERLRITVWTDRDETHRPVFDSDSTATGTVSYLTRLGGMSLAIRQW